MQRLIEFLSSADGAFEGDMPSVNDIISKLLTLQCLNKKVKHDQSLVLNFTFPTRFSLDSGSHSERKKMYTKVYTKV